MFTLLTLATKSNWDGDADKVTAGWISYVGAKLQPYLHPKAL